MPSEITYFEKLDRLTELKVTGGPISDGVDEVFELIADNDVRRHFLGTVESSNWIGPLLGAGVFAKPIPAIRLGTVSQYPNWPESQYLARMASQSPAEVAAVLSSITTDNPSIVRDIVKAAAAMPATISSKLVPQVCRAAVEGALWLYFKDASDFCLYLARSGETNSAIELATALFDPIPFDNDGPGVRRRDDYWYREGLKEVVPVLVEKAPAAILSRLCVWLENLVKGKDYSRDSDNDFSYVWRPAIQENEQNYDSHLAAVMVGVVRMAFEQALRSGGVSLPETLRELEARRYLVFKRLRVYLVAEFAEEAADLARALIVDRSLFDNYMFEHEYSYLMERGFGLLSDQERRTWFGWVDEGPDLTGFDDRLREGLGREATDEDRQIRIRYWQFEKLHSIRDHLNDERKHFYNEMLAESGSPDLSERNAKAEARWGPESPFSLEVLSDLAFEEVVETVASWKWKGTRSTIEGLASTFEQYLAGKPEEYSMSAEALIDRPAIFVRSFISQMSKAVKDGRNIDLERVLRLSKWVIDRPITEDPETAPPQDQEQYREWQWTKDEISQLIHNICTATNEGLPKYAIEGLREPMWQVILKLCLVKVNSYPNRDEEDDDPRLRDYLMRGINSSQGKAIEAALEYARWVANHNKKFDEGRVVIPGGFELMPEVRKLLEHIISPENRSVETMAIVGSRINLIYWIDSDWLRTKTESIFDLEAIENVSGSIAGWAAWNGFLVWVHPHIEYYRLFKSQFAYAVAQSPHVTVKDKTAEQPMFRLGEHLVILYGRGHIGLDEDGGLVRHLITDANPNIRRHALTFAGQTIGEKVPNEVIERLTSLWETYWAGAGKWDAEDKSGAWLFGRWFSSKVFPEQWALDQLEEYVRVMPTPEPERNIVEHLVETSSRNLVQAIRILSLMVQGDEEGWRIQSWIDLARGLLENAMRNSGEPRQRAIELINHLGRLGYDDLGQLLKT